MQSQRCLNRNSESASNAKDARSGIPHATTASSVHVPLCKRSSPVHMSFCSSSGKAWVLTIASQANWERPKRKLLMYNRSATVHANYKACNASSNNYQQDENLSMAELHVIEYTRPYQMPNLMAATHQKQFTEICSEVTLTPNIAGPCMRTY